MKAFLLLTIKKRSMKKGILKSLLNISLGAITAIVFTSASAPFDTPSRPGRPEITDIRDDRCDIQFKKPESDGGSRITGYIVEKKEKYSPRWLQACVAKRPSCTVYNLIEGSIMEFRALASNKAGLSEPSYPSNPVVIRGPFKP